VTDILDELHLARPGGAVHRRGRAARGARERTELTAYCGFDPTAPSLHFGNLVQLSSCAGCSGPGIG
jgi:tyrosyl-tRNA synthetase